MQGAADLIASGPRQSGTEGARIAALWIKNTLDRLGLVTELDEFEEAVPGGSSRFRNVIARIPGNASLILLIAHYDTKGGIGDRFQGANDSGSGVGVLMELARVLHERHSTQGNIAAAGRDQKAPTFWLAFLDGEECRVSYGPGDGLHGSRRLAGQMRRLGLSSQVKAVILLDMIGDRDLTVTIPRNSTPDLVALAFATAATEGARSQFTLFPGAILDDHQPFLDAGMPALDLIDFEYGSAPRLNDYWHTDDDTLDKLSARSLETVGRVTVRMLNVLALTGAAK